MHFTSGINRPPYEGESGYLQVTSGCSYNRCRFCSYYKTDRYSVSSISEIEDDARSIEREFDHPRRIFLQSADAFSAGYDVLMATADMIHAYAPSVKEIGGYARIDNFVGMTVEQVRDLRDAGYSDPYIGVESGDDNLLKLMNKGYDSRTARAQLEKLEEAGMPYIVNWIDGLGGRGYGMGHAIATAELYRGLHPTMIDISSLVVVPGTVLWRMMQKGRFEEAGEVERLQELQEFLRRLDNDTLFQAYHVSVPFQVRTRIPEHTQELIGWIQELIDTKGEKGLRRYREEVASRGYSPVGKAAMENR